MVFGLFFNSKNPKKLLTLLKGPKTLLKRKRPSVDQPKCEWLTTKEASKSKNANVLTVQTKSVKKKMPVLTPLQMPENANDDAEDQGLYLNQSDLSENTRVLLRLEVRSYSIILKIIS